MKTAHHRKHDKEGRHPDGNAKHCYQRVERDGAVPLSGFEVPKRD
jgi:hypothetical protein